MQKWSNTSNDAIREKATRGWPTLFAFKILPLSKFSLKLPDCHQNETEITARLAALVDWQFPSQAVRMDWQLPSQAAQMDWQLPSQAARMDSSQATRMDPRSRSVTQRPHKRGVPSGDSVGVPGSGKCVAADQKDRGLGLRACPEKDQLLRWYGAARESRLFHDFPRNQLLPERRTNSLAVAPTARRVASESVSEIDRPWPVQSGPSPTSPALHLGPSGPG